MLPTIERWPRRSTYSSPTLHFSSPRPCWADLPLPFFPSRSERAVPLASWTATRVSPGSTDTNIRFLKISPRDRLSPSADVVPSVQGCPALGGELRLHVHALKQPDRHERRQHG